MLQRFGGAWWVLQWHSSDAGEAIRITLDQIHDRFVIKFGPGFATLAIELVTDAGGVGFHRRDADVAFGHDFEAIGHFGHAWIGVEPVAFGELDLQGIVVGVLRRKIPDAESFAVVFDLIDQLHRNVMMMDVDGTGRALGHRCGRCAAS